MILSVSQINDYIRALLDNDDLLLSAAVRGEISNLTFHRSGHIYFTLKDEGGTIKAVMFRSSAARVKFALREGMNVIVFGRISVYSPTGQYQLYASDIQPDGIGALYVAFEQIKKKLESEGLFAPERKKPIPQIPSRVGIITSPTGAAIHDMINVMGRRFPLAELVLYPALVQGEGAPRTLIAGIEYFNSAKSVDVIIIGRGGGSMEDLWAFNDAGLAYAIAGSELPVISAVGHESDFTICDFVADMRAPTPSAAAELAVPDSENIKYSIHESAVRIKGQLADRIEKYRRYIEILSRSRVLASKEALLDEYKMKINLLCERLDRAILDELKTKRAGFTLTAAKLEAISPLATLSRGYAIVRSEKGHALTSVLDAEKGDKINLAFSDGELTAEIKEVKKKKGQRTSARKGTDDGR